jgi:hypothetical protein
MGAQPGSSVADIDHTADGQILADDLDDMMTVRGRDPAPYAMQDDDVETGQVIARSHLLEGLLEQGHRQSCSLARAEACATCCGLKSVPQNDPAPHAAWMVVDRP